MSTTTKNTITLDGKDMLVLPAKYPSTEIKEVLGGRWDSEHGAWRVPPTSFTVSLLHEWYGPELIESAPKVIQDLLNEEWGWERDQDVRDECARHERWDDLYPFQQDAVEYLVDNPHNAALLALSPGLGKTPVSVVAMDTLDVQRVLVVAPLTLTRNWVSEIARWSDKTWNVKRANAQDKSPGPEITVTNFETVMESTLIEQRGTDKKKRVWNLRPEYDLDWDLVIVDESIMVKNRKANRSKVLESLSARSRYIWLLSGSPTSKYRDDLYQQFKILHPRAFASYWRFAEYFCIVTRNQWGWEIQGDRPNVEPQVLLKDLMLVRNQKDVLPELPEYIFRTVEVDLTKAQQKMHDTMLHDWVAELENGDVQEASIRLAQLMRLQQIASNTVNIDPDGKAFSAKEDALVDLMRSADVEYPMLVWTHWVPTAKALHARLEKEFPNLKVELVVGEMTDEQKEKGISDYKEGRADVLIMQLGVGKFGHTFTDTRTVVYHDKSWDSDAYVQSIRRVRRIGLDHSPVLITLKAPGTADDLVELNLAGKLESISKVSNADLVELLQGLGS